MDNTWLLRLYLQYLHSPLILKLVQQLHFLRCVFPRIAVGVVCFRQSAIELLKHGLIILSVVIRKISTVTIPIIPTGSQVRLIGLWEIVCPGCFCFVFLAMYILLYIVRFIDSYSY